MKIVDRAFDVFHGNTIDELDGVNLTSFVFDAHHLNDRESFLFRQYVFSQILQTQKEEKNEQ